MGGERANARKNVGIGYGFPLSELGRSQPDPGVNPSRLQPSPAWRDKANGSHERINASMGYPPAYRQAALGFWIRKERGKSVLLSMTACGCRRRGHIAAPAGWVSGRMWRRSRPRTPIRPPQNYARSAAGP